MLKKELEQRLEVMASNCRLLERKYNELKDFYEAKTIYVKSLQAENEMNERVIEKLLTENRRLKQKDKILSVTQTYCENLENENENLKDTVRQLLDMIDELRETGEINW